MLIYVLIGILVLSAILLSLFIFFDQGQLFAQDTIRSLETSKQIIALTFDDGPHPKWTPEILNLLKRYQVPASFFLVGECVARYPELARTIAEEGHCIGNHSYRHEPLWICGEDTFVRSIMRTQNIIKSVAGVTPAHFRPPKGILLPSQKLILTELGLKSTLWSLNSKDWCSRSPKKMLKRIRQKLACGDIILFHDGGGVIFKLKASRKTTLNCLEDLIKELKAENWRFVSLNEHLPRVTQKANAH